MTPIRCVVTLGSDLLRSVKSENSKNKADLIVCTSKLLLSQVKNLLDKSLLENGNFVPQIQKD